MWLAPYERTSCLVVGVPYVFGFLGAMPPPPATAQLSFKACVALEHEARSPPLRTLMSHTNPCALGGSAAAIMLRFLCVSACAKTRPELSATQRRAPSARRTDGSPVHGSAGARAPHFVHCGVKGVHRAGAGCGGVDSFTWGKRRKPVRRCDTGTAAALPFSRGRLNITAKQRPPPCCSGTKYTP